MDKAAKYGPVCDDLEFLNTSGSIFSGSVRVASPYGGLVFQINFTAALKLALVTDNQLPSMAT